MTPALSAAGARHRSCPCKPRHMPTGPGLWSACQPTVTAGSGRDDGRARALIAEADAGERAPAAAQAEGIVRDWWAPQAGKRYSQDRIKVEVVRTGIGTERRGSHPGVLPHPARGDGSARPGGQTAVPGDRTQRTDPRAELAERARWLENRTDDHQRGRAGARHRCGDIHRSHAPSSRLRVTTRCSTPVRGQFRPPGPQASHRIAIGLTGNPVPVGSRSGAIMHRNDQRPISAHTCLSSVNCR